MTHMATRAHPRPSDADNSSGSSAAACSVWRAGPADSMLARTTTESTSDAGYTTAGEIRSAISPDCLSYLRDESTYERLGGPTDCSLLSATNRLIHALGRGRILRQLGSRTPWPNHQFTTAVGAMPAKNGSSAAFAERAFERADAGFSGIWRERSIAALA